VWLAANLLAYQLAVGVWRRPHTEDISIWLKKRGVKLGINGGGCQWLIQLAVAIWPMQWLSQLS